MPRHRLAHVQLFGSTSILVFFRTVPCITPGGMWSYNSTFAVSHYNFCTMRPVGSKVDHRKRLLPYCYFGKTEAEETTEKIFATQTITIISRCCVSILDIQPKIAFPTQFLDVHFDWFIVLIWTRPAWIFGWLPKVVMLIAMTTFRYDHMFLQALPTFVLYHNLKYSDQFEL